MYLSSLRLCELCEIFLLDFDFAGFGPGRNCLDVQMMVSGNIANRCGLSAHGYRMGDGHIALIANTRQEVASGDIILSPLAISSVS